MIQTWTLSFFSLQVTSWHLSSPFRISAFSHQKGVKHRIPSCPLLVDWIYIWWAHINRSHGSGDLKIPNMVTFSEGQMGSWHTQELNVISNKAFFDALIKWGKPCPKQSQTLLNDICKGILQQLTFANHATLKSVIVVLSPLTMFDMSYFLLLIVQCLKLVFELFTPRSLLCSFICCLIPIKMDLLFLCQSLSKSLYKYWKINMSFSGLHCLFRTVVTVI